MKKYILSISLISIILFSSICFASDAVPIWSYNAEDVIETMEQKEDTITNSVDLKLESGAGILMEQNSGKILYEHNSHEKLYPASVTKIMSILLIMENIDNRNN